MTVLHKLRRVWSADTHSSRRWRAILETAATSMADRVTTGFCALAQIPLAVGYLGNEAYGLWMTLSAVVSAMVVADLGLSIGLQNRMADAFGRDEIGEIRQAWKTGAIMLAVIGMTIAAATLPICWWVNWTRLFKLQDAVVAAQTPACLAIMLCSFGIGLPLTTVHRLAFAVQLGWMANVKSSLQALVTLALVACAVWLKLSLSAFLVVIVSPPVIANFFLLVALHKKLGWQQSDSPPFSQQIKSELLGRNLLFILPQLGATALTAVPPIILSSLLGAAAATPWNVIQRVLGLAPQVQQMFLSPLWPAYTEANARGDLGWVQATYRKSIWLSVVGVVIPTLSFLFWGRWVVSFLGKQSLDSVDHPLLVASCVWTAVQLLCFPAANLLNAHGWIIGQAIYGTIAVTISLLIMPLVVSHFGTAGVPLSMLATFIPFAAPLTLWEANYHLKKRERAVLAMRHLAEVET